MRASLARAARGLPRRLQPPAQRAAGAVARPTASNDAVAPAPGSPPPAPAGAAAPPAQSLGSIVAEGFSFGIGSSIAHHMVGSLFGGGGHSAPAAAPPPAAPPADEGASGGGGGGEGSWMDVFDE